MTRATHLKACQDPCPSCGKQCYRSRHGAREAGRILHPNRRMYAYRCGMYWHFTSTIVRQRRAA